DMESTVESLPTLAQLPQAVARYVDALDLDASLAEQKSHRGVCWADLPGLGWPEFAALGWSGAGLAIEARPTQGQDRLGITGTFCAVAETGTLVITSGAGRPTPTVLGPGTGVAVVGP